MSSAKKRPVPVWLIAIFGILAALSQLISHTALISGALPLDERMQSHLDSWSLLDKAWPYLLNIVLLAASKSLLAMKKVSLQLYISYLILVTIATVQHAITTKWIETFGKGALSALGGLAIFTIIVVYVYRLRKDGRLS